MDRFGPHWADHPRQIRENAEQIVAPGDVLLLPGDLSWATKRADALPDLHFLAALAWRIKTAIKGNHDHWWDSGKPIAFPGLAIAADTLGRRAGNRRNARLVRSRRRMTKTRKTGRQDRKILERERGRLLASLAAIEGCAVKIAMLHYPPHPFLSELREAGVAAVVYGHVHLRSLPEDERLAVADEVVEGVRIYCVAADRIDFTPKADSVTKSPGATIRCAGAFLSFQARSNGWFRSYRAGKKPPPTPMALVLSAVNDVQNLRCRAGERSADDRWSAGKRHDCSRCVVIIHQIRAAREDAEVIAVRSVQAGAKRGDLVRGCRRRRRGTANGRLDETGANARGMVGFDSENTRRRSQVARFVGNRRTRALIRRHAHILERCRNPSRKFASLANGSKVEAMPAAVAAALKLLNRSICRFRDGTGTGGSQRAAKKQNMVQFIRRQLRRELLIRGAGEGLTGAIAVLVPVFVMT